jgi:hypothetical protein
VAGCERSHRFPDALFLFRRQSDRLVESLHQVAARWQGTQFSRGVLVVPIYDVCHTRTMIVPFAAGQGGSPDSVDY